MEVVLSIAIAGGILITVFAMFPVSLQQGFQSKEDIAQSMFAGSFFEIVSYNVSQICTMTEWEQENTWWGYARGDWDALPDGVTLINTGIIGRLQDSQNMKTFALDIPGNIRTNLFESNNNPFAIVRYVSDRNVDPTSSDTLVLPRQFLMRVQIIPGDILNISGAPTLPGSTFPTTPSIYRVSIVSTIQEYPSLFYDNTIYQMDFAFTRKP